MIACPNCGGALEFDISSQKLKCPSCRQKYGVNSVRDNNGPAGAYSFNVFRCSQCGGEVYSNDNTIAGFCSYCGAPAVLNAGAGEVKTPPYIVPFKVDKKECKKIFDKFVGNNRYVPDDYKPEEGIHEFRGIYVPYHVYEAEFDGTYHMKGKSETMSGSGDRKKCNVKIWDINADVSGSINKITHDASDTFDDDQSELINDNYKGYMDFELGYLCGFYADSADVPSEEYTEYVKELAYEKTDKSVAVKLPGSINIKHSYSRPDIKITNKGEVLKPVWFMSYRNNDRMAYSVINGRSGKISCDLPVDIKWFFKISLVIALVLFVILNLLQNFMLTAKSSLVMAVFLNLILSVFYNMNIRKMYNHEIRRRNRGDHGKGIWQRIKKRRGVVLFAIIMAVFMAVTDLVIIPLVTAAGEYRESSVTFKVFVCALIAFIQIIMISVDAHKYTALFKNKTRSVPVSLLLLAATMVIAAVAFINPVDDIWYYIVVMGTYAVDIFTIFGIIRDYNLSCTRPLPQFEIYKGGREHDRD